MKILVVGHLTRDPSARGATTAGCMTAACESIAVAGVGPSALTRLAEAWDRAGEIVFEERR